MSCPTSNLAFKCLQPIGHRSNAGDIRPTTWGSGKRHPLQVIISLEALCTSFRGLRGPQPLMRPDGRLESVSLFGKPPHPRSGPWRIAIGIGLLGLKERMRGFCSVTAIQPSSAAKYSAKNASLRLGLPTQDTGKEFRTAEHCWFSTESSAGSSVGYRTLNKRRPRPPPQFRPSVS